MNLNESLLSLKGKSFLSISDLNFEQINSLIDLALNFKNKKAKFDYRDKVLGIM